MYPFSDAFIKAVFPNSSVISILILVSLRKNLTSSKLLMLTACTNGFKPLIIKFKSF